MNFGRDGKNQLYVEWQVGKGGYKRAWVQHRTEPDKDWAGSGRYLNVVRAEGYDTGPKGNATDFPIFSNLPDKQILVAFVTAVSAITVSNSIECWTPITPLKGSNLHAE